MGCKCGSQIILCNLPVRFDTYRGCSHGCIYCDSRSSCYQMPHAFEDIEVKQNALVLLEEALRRKRKKCMIGTGSMTDPYIPLDIFVH